MGAITYVMVFDRGGDSIGRFMIEAILEDGGFSVSVLSRNSSRTKYPSAVQKVRVDDRLPHEQLVAALEGQDAVISAVGFGPGVLSSQTSVIDAAIKANRKRFFLSKHTFHNAGPKALWLSPFFEEKFEIEQYLNKKVKDNPDLSWSAVATSTWLEWALDAVFIGIDPVEHVVTYWDEGTHTPTMSTLPYAAKGVVNAETRNKRVFLNRLDASQREVVAELEKQQGVKYTKLEPVVGSKAIQEAHERNASSGGSDAAAAITTAVAQALVEAYGSNFKKAGKSPILEDFVSMPKMTLLK